MELFLTSAGVLGVAFTSSAVDRLLVLRYDQML
jgi:hypothetical protein